MLEQQFKFKRIMLIDDNTIDLYITARLVTKYYFGEEILQYNSATNALGFLKQNDNDLDILPQIIFLDLHMPKMSGFEFMTEYDKLSSCFKGNCKVYILSSSLDKEDIKRSDEDINIVAFQVKAITKNFLDDIIHDI